MTGPRQSEFVRGAPGRDWWPLTRFIITAAVLGLWAHLYLGWQVRPWELLALAGQVLGVLSVLAMLSFVLADLYLLVLLTPLYIAGAMNDWAYELSRWFCRAVLGFRSGRLLTFGGLCGEILLFGGITLLLRWTIL